MSIGWAIFIALVVISVIYIGKKIIVPMIKYHSTKRKYEKVNNQFIDVSFEEIHLNMEDTLNKFRDIEENLTAVKDMVSEERREEIQELVDLTEEFRFEYDSIKSEITKKEFRNSESLKDIRKSINSFNIRLNNDLAVRVRQLSSKIRKEQGIK